MEVALKYMGRVNGPSFIGLPFTYKKMGIVWETLQDELGGEERVRAPALVDSDTIELKEGVYSYAFEVCPENVRLFKHLTQGEKPNFKFINPQDELVAIPAESEGGKKSSKRGKTGEKSKENAEIPEEEDENSGEDGLV